jgi:hypothetical protein
VAGTWDLAKGKSGAAVARFERLREHLDGLAYVPSYCAAELVQWRHKSTRAARIYWGLVAVVELWCSERGIPLIPISVGDVKRRATGRGDSSKEDMLAAAAVEFPDVELVSHARHRRCAVRRSGGRQRADADGHVHAGRLMGVTGRRGRPGGALRRLRKERLGTLQDAAGLSRISASHLAAIGRSTKSNGIDGQTPERTIGPVPGIMERSQQEALRHPTSS